MKYSRLGAVVLLLCSHALAVAQTPTPAPPTTPPTSDDDGLTVLDSSVGYIDNPVPTNQVYLRSDSGYGFRFPNRAEFFYGKPQPDGPGLPKAERSISYTELAIGLEHTVGRRASVFAEIPVRFLNPEINDNASGLSDVRAGFKYQFWLSAKTTATFQLRAYAPSGNAASGLGAGHASLEPALLAAHAATDRLILLSEFRVWSPVDGTDFAGEVLRYGFGGRYDLYRSAAGVRYAPTLELVGWQVLRGQEQALGQAVPESAGGTSVLNLKVGGRVDWNDRVGVYAGYGRALTGEKWYADIFRVEVRVLY